MVTDTNLRLRNPGLVWSSELREAAYYHGYRGENGEADGWLFFRNQEGVPGEIALAVGPGEEGEPWFLAVDHPGVIAEFDGELAGPAPGRFGAAYSFPNRAELRAGITRVFHLARSVPDHPLQEFERETAHLGDTEAEQLLKRRIGQDRFRAALMDYWEARCPMTGITERELLRASHIIPWAECESDFQRLDVHNGLLLAAHYDAAFDKGLISFDEDGRLLMKADLSSSLAELLETKMALGRLTAKHLENLAWHRANFDFHGYD